MSEASLLYSYIILRVGTTSGVYFINSLVIKFNVPFSKTPYSVSNSGTPNLDLVFYWISFQNSLSIFVEYKAFKCGRMKLDRTF